VCGLLIDGKIRIQPWHSTPPIPSNPRNATPPWRKQGKGATLETAYMHNAQRAETANTLQIAPHTEKRVLLTVDDVIRIREACSNIVPTFTSRSREATWGTMVGVSFFKNVYSKMLHVFLIFLK